MLGKWLCSRCKVPGASGRRQYGLVIPPAVPVLHASFRRQLLSCQVCWRKNVGIFPLQPAKYHFKKDLPRKDRLPFFRGEQEGLSRKKLTLCPMCQCSLPQEAVFSYSWSGDWLGIRPELPTSGCPGNLGLRCDAGPGAACKPTCLPTCFD